MQRVVFDGQPSDVERVVGRTSYARGRAYARNGHVLTMAWDSKLGVLSGQVSGRGAVYQAMADFDDRRETFEAGSCTCPVGYNCKHVAALVLTAIGSRPVREEKPKVPAWESALQPLLGSAPNTAPGTIPMALELTLVPGSRNQRGRPGHTPARLLAKLMQPGKKKGWVSGNLAWNSVGYLGYQGLDPAHSRILNELYALHQAGGYGFQSYQAKTIDLCSFQSGRLWPVLEEAQAAGLRLIHSHEHLGDVVLAAVAEYSLDATRTTASGSLAITPALTVGGHPVDAVPLGFFGTDGHGLLYTERADIEAEPDPARWPLRLARLATPAPPALQQLVLAGERIAIPAKQVTKFRESYYPRLRHIAPLISSDESFTPPAISDPKLTLNAAYGPEHSLDLSWEWIYEVGDTLLRTPVNQEERPDSGYRDLAKEKEILAGLDPGLVSNQPKTLRGNETLRFSTESLPLLADRPEIDVEISGDPADYREVSDTLSIGVSTEEIHGETDWFDLGITITAEGREVPFTEVFLALAAGQPHLLLPDGAYFSLEKPELRTLRTLIEEARSLQDSPGDPLRISRYQVGLWDELASLGVVGRQAKNWQRQLDALRSIDTVDVVEPPDTLDATLRPYQLDGFRWLAFLWRFQLGGILADDMGLGKTLQSLALICHAKRQDPDLPPFLIIAPTSVVSNWAAESARFSPGLNVVAISDTARRRGTALDEIVEGADLVVTSHTLFRLDFDDYAALPWSGLIMDEAQFAKNHQSRIYQCARRLPAPVKLAITGTPMENSLMELWSLLSITAPGLFPNPARFAEFYARPIERDGDTDLLAQLRRRIKPLITRRTKEQVLTDLPAKQEQVLEVELPPRHRKIYQTHLQRERQKVLGLIDDLNRNRFTILRSLTLLRQLSLHAGLVDEKHRNLASAKVDALLEQLGDVAAGGHRALVFSQFTGFLDIVRDRLDAEGVEYCYLDGKTRNRASVLKRFKEGAAPVFLISLKAGGVGLNLTEADYCFLLDPWWNPATEAQAVDRTHRIGQTRTVMVYRLIAKDTIEEKVMALKAKKAELFAGVMDDGNAFGGSLDADDIRGLFG